MEQAYKPHKVRDFSIGFFGWWLICIPGFFFSDQYRLDLYWAYVFPVLIAIVIGILFFQRRNWFAYGIVAAPITNTLIWVLIIGLFGGFDWETMTKAFFTGLWIPFFYFAT